MFGQDDNQQQPGVDNGAMQASMPDPLPNNGLGGGPPNSGAPFGDPNNQPFTPPPPPDAGPADSPPASSDPAPSEGNDDLANLKQQALQHLSPLVGQLDQNPEEKFRTTMMMIQASDDHSLIKEAFESAKQITDDKARAQALLDVINEINYFTQNSQ